MTAAMARSDDGAVAPGPDEHANEHVDEDPPTMPLLTWLTIVAAGGYLTWRLVHMLVEAVNWLRGA